MTSATPPPSPESLSERLARLFGADVDPHISIAPVGESVSASEVVEELLRSGGVAERYEVRGEIDRGGMGVVLDVWDRELRRPLAMKVALGIQAEPAAGAPDRRRLLRFLEEAQITGQLDHPGIVPVHELGVDAEGRVFFTMRRVRGRDLREVLHSAYFGLDGWNQTRVLGVLLRVCETLAFAHSRGVLHRDIKPANVMVGAYGEVYVMDWGLARVIGRAQPSLAPTAGAHESVDTLLRDERRRAPDSPMVTSDGDVLGTPAYMPPEQARGERDELSPRGDLYSVGALLYHLCAGEAPYYPSGRQTTLVDALEALRRGPPRPLAGLQPGLAPELVAITEKAMAYDPAERYGAMDELARDLRAWLEGRVVAALEQGAWAEARKWIQRNRALAAALGSAAALLVLGLISSLLLKAQSDTNAQRADAEAREAEQNLTLAQRNAAEANRQREAAERNAARAQEQQQLAAAETVKVLRLSDAKVLQELLAKVDELWPAYPEQIPALESWVKRARALVSNLPDHRARLAEMRSRAHAWSDEERARDRATHPRTGELAEKQAEMEGLIAQLDQGLAGEAGAQADTRVAELEPELEALTVEVESRRSWRFDSTAEDWQHGVLAELIGDLSTLESELLAEDAVTAEYGWSVPRRLAFARELEVGFGAGGEYAQAWSQALPEIHAAYPGLNLKPQVGLVPIGPDPASGLWEFAHLMTGAPAARGEDGRLKLTEATGVVLTLLSGGSFWMGAQQGDPGGHNYDPHAQSHEGPVHELQLSPFFLSKYEMTQGQWMRLTGHNPSAYGRDSYWGTDWLANGAAVSRLHPVEQVSWIDCTEWLPKAGLTLPSEAQWEYGARGGSENPWWTGPVQESLAGAANLSDKWAGEHGGQEWLSLELWLNDGATVHAGAGNYASNAYGLHDVVGNVWEWCKDGFDLGFYARSARLDPECPWMGTSTRVVRGGSFQIAAAQARSACRNSVSPNSAEGALGVRPARSIDP